MLSKFLLSTTAVLLFSTHVLAAKPDTSEKTAKDDPYILMELFGAAFSAWDVGQIRPAFRFYGSRIL